MACFVDNVQEYPPNMIAPAARKHGALWCHLYADSVEELHAMAGKLGLKRAWFQDKRLQHYDLTPAMREKALAAGAVEDIGRAAFMRVLKR